MNTPLLLADRALAVAIQGLERLRRQVGRRAASDDDQRRLVIEIERIEDQVANVRDEPVERRIHDAAELMNDLRRARAKAQKLNFSRHAARTVQARIEAATTSMLVDVFDIDLDVIKDFGERLFR